MRTVFQSVRLDTGTRITKPGWATGRFPSTILAVIVAATTILSLAGCRSREYPGSASGRPPYGMSETYYPPGYPVPPSHIVEGRRYSAGARGRERRKERARGAERQAVPDSSSYWNGDHLSGSPSIQIDLRTQRAYFYKGQELAGVSPVSTGRPGYDTPTGSFRVTEKSPNHRSNLYGEYVDANGAVVKAGVDKRRDEAPPGTKFRGASMPNFLRFNDAIGMHGGHLPGYPASSGCVRLPEDMARHFFANAPPGTPVMVVR